MEIIKSELPKVTVNEQALAEATKTLCNDVEAQSAAALKKLKISFEVEIKDDLESLKTFVNEANFRAFLSDAEKSYLGTKYLPSGERERVSSMFQELLDKNIDSIRTLNRIFELPYILKYDGERITLNDAEVEKKIRKNFVVNLTDEQRTYYRLLAEAKNAIAAIGHFETEHHFEPFCNNGFYSETNMGYYKRIEFFPYLCGLDEQIFLNSCRSRMFESKF